MRTQNKMTLIQQYPLVVSATLINLVQYLYTGFKVGGARQKYGVKAPATTGRYSISNHVQ